MRKAVYIVFGVYLLLSCSIMQHRSSLSAKEYADLFQSSGYALRDTINESSVVFVLTGITKEIECTRWLVNQTYSKEDIKRYYDTTAATMSYELFVQLPVSGTDIYNYNTKSSVALADRSAYFSFGFKKNIRLVTTQNDTLPCSFMLNERGISHSPYAKFLIEFTSDKHKIVPKEVIIQEAALTGKQLVFNIEKFQHSQLPTLRFE